MARKVAKSKGKSSHGGRRPGSGRKTNDFSTLRLEILEAFDQKNVRELPRLFENMRFLANGRYERIEEEWTPNPVDEGEGTDYAQPLVMTKRKISIAEPDRAANQYLIDRVLGRPKQALEHSGPDGKAIPVEVDHLIQKIYGPPRESDSDNDGD